MLNNICHLNDISNKYGIKVTTIALLNTKTLYLKWISTFQSDTKKEIVHFFDNDIRI